MWTCYILRCLDDNHSNLTYNGSTNNIIRRLRQHNCEIVGGAKYTKGKQWEIYMLLTGFKTNTNALSCEWRIKHPTLKKLRPKKYCGVHGRILGLCEILSDNKWTSKCTINNCDCDYILYITNDVSHLIDTNIIPPNIKIVCVDKINKDFLETLS